MGHITTATSLVDLLCQRMANGADAEALWRPRDGQWQTVRWSEYGRDIAQLASALVRMGVGRGDRVAHLSENRYEWIVTDLAILSVGAIHVPIHATLSASQVGYQVQHSGAKLAIASSTAQVQKLAGVAQEFAGRLVVIADEKPTTEWPTPVIGFREWMESGELAHGRQVLETMASSLGSEDLATILYTSGTTGEPKGVMLSHGNLVSNTLATLQTFDPDPRMRRLNFLPFSHIFARTCDLYIWIAGGTELALARSRETVLEDCKATQPTWVNGVPYFFEKVWRGLREQGTADEPGSLREILGGRIKYCHSGGAALSPQIFDYYFSQGVPLLEGYGLTESSPVITASTRHAVKRGSVGQPIPGVDVRISEEGEIQTRGPQVMKGYYRDAASTEEAVRDGWLSTGDLGTLDADGFLRITGRKKELIVTAAGKNIAPVLLESRLTQDPRIQQAIVIGDARNYLVALVVPDWERVRSEAFAGEPDETQCSSDSPDTWRNDPRVRDLIAQAIADRLADLSPHEQVRRFTLLLRPFTIEQGELTPKLTLRRQQIESIYAREIAELYTRAPSTTEPLPRGSE
ncbi:MAG: hypothetical protein RIS70_80 [Planctomycetota bacterium]